MTKKKGTDQGRTQKTDKDYEIPVPSRGDFYDALEKAVEPHEKDEESDVRDGGKEKK